MTYYDQVVEAAEALSEKTRSKLGGHAPRVGIVLGSGLGAVADAVADPVFVPYGEIPHFPQSTVEGHSGRIVAGMLGGVPVVVMQGRVHSYEGYTPQQVTFPMRVLGTLGVRAVVLTNAAGGIQQGYNVGPACGAGRPHQPDGMESAERAERAALCDAQGRGAALLRHDGGVQQEAAGAGEGGRGGRRIRAGRGRLPGDAGAEL